MQTTMQETGSNNKQGNISIRFSADGFSFCSGNGKKKINFDKADKSLRRAMAVCLCESDVWDDDTSVDILIDNDTTSLIPSSMFSNDECLDILKFNFPNLDFTRYNLHTDYIDGFDITNIYAISSELDKFLKDYFPYAAIGHVFSRLVQKSLRSSRSNNNRELWINISGGTMYASLTKGGTLILANCYPISAAGDVLYWIGSIYNHYNLSQQTVPLWVSGDNCYTETLSERIAVCKTFSI